MKGHNKKMELLGSAPIPKALLAMGIPTMIGMMISAIYNLVDAYFVGGLGTSQMGAISVTYPLSQVIVGLGLLFGNGAGSYISRLLGRGNNDDAKKVASTALYSGLLLGIIFIIGTLAFLEPILKFLGTTESIMPYAIKYARIFIAASIFNIFNVMMNNIITSEGAAKISMFAMLSGALLNMILDPIFINVLNMGVTGAAIASAIGQALSTVVFLSYILMKKSIFTFKIKDCCYSKENMKEILKIGVPTLVFQLLTSLSIILINNQANALSVTHTKEYVDSVIAGMGAVTRIVSMGSLIVFGFIKGFQPIAGYSYGAKNFKRLNESIKTSILWSTVFCVLFGLILILFPATIISKFTADISPYAYARSMPNTTSNEVSYRYGFNGTCCTMATGCTTGIDSIGFAYDQIRCGELDVMICGAAEAPITPITIAAFEAIGTLSTNNNPPEKASRPFDDTRNGFVLAEAAGILVLEELRHALNRGAHIYGEIAGYGSVNNAMHMTGLKPDGEDLSRAIKIAIEEANITPFEIDYINAHGSGTKQNDINETGAYKKVFGELAYKIPMSSTKSMTGHPLGAASAVEAIVCCLALENNFMPPTINYNKKDALCDLDYIPNCGREKNLNVVLTNASGFGGLHAAMILKKYID